MSTFEGAYGIDDGYVDGGRRHNFTITEDDLWLPLDATDAEIERVFYDLMEEDYKQRVVPYAKNLEEFKVWARAVLDRQDTE